ncbi:radical SAM protein [Candidatus Woesearchaeota archaeon]|nr:radical SAM protein [Candidatus Woesearchaeota archaeon]
MAKLIFEDLSFEQEKQRIKVNFLNIFYFYLDNTELEKTAKFNVNKNSISFQGISEQKAKNKFNQLLNKGFQNLKNKITGQKTIYIHQNSEIPLIGHNAFGLIDRNTSIIEVRAITGCNLDCIYCSVTQDLRPIDFVIEKDYLVKEFKKLVEFKDINDIEAHIGTQGEPLLYKPLPELIKGLSDIQQVSTIALDTNGTLLTKQKVDELVDAGLTRFCFSINALNQELAQKIAGSAYNLNHILDILKYISKKECELILTPVWIPGINDQEIPKLLELSKELGCNIGIQNFLNYRFGKNPVKQMSWQLFIKKMKELEEKYDKKLLFDFKQDFNIKPTKPLPKPFKKGQIIKTKILLPGRLKDEKLAVEKQRIISIPNCDAQIGQTVKLKIIRTKHNIFFAVLI